jgi:hypothetical protein
LTAGWHLNVLNLWSTGQPFTVLNASNISNTSPGGSADRLNVLSDPFKDVRPVSNNPQFSMATLIQQRVLLPLHLITDRTFVTGIMSVFKEFSVYRETKLQVCA